MTNGWIFEDHDKHWWTYKCPYCGKYIYLNSDNMSNFPTSCPLCQRVVAKKRNTVKERLEWAKEKGFMTGMEFSLFIQDLLISEDGYVIDTGTYENVNAVAALELVKKIKKHPILWKMFFMIA